LELAGSDDVVTQTMARQVQAKVLARRGQLDEAASLAREAVVLAGNSDGVIILGYALLDLAEVLELAGRRTEAAEVLHEALALYERKGALALSDRARKRLSALEPVA
jgi:tetratricopeptide (TPR) repeat protein